MSFKKQVEVLKKEKESLLSENIELRRAMMFHTFPYIIPIITPKHSFKLLDDPLEGFHAGALLESDE